MKIAIKWSAAHRNTVILAVCGLFLFALLALSTRYIRAGYRQASGYHNVIARASQLITESRLHYYRVIENNRPGDLEKEVLPVLAEVTKILDVLYAGGKISGSDFPEPGEDTKAIVKNVLYDVQQVVSVIRHQKQLGAINRTEVESSYEVASQSLIKVSKVFTDQAKAIEKRTQTIALLSLVVPGVILIVAIGLYFRFYSNRLSLEQTLRARLDEETMRVETLSKFIEAISHGDYSITITGDDQTGLTGRLMAMRDKLKANAEEDARRNWATQGLAQIGEILRDTADSGLMYDKLIRFVVTYTGSNQGGLFLLNDDEENNPFLELVSAYAFERKKFITKRVEIGQGMVGQCYLEADRIFLAKLPEAYVHITSGLGGATPTCLLLVPLKANEKVYGVLELASFKRLEEHEIQLVEKFAESIAATVSTVKVNESTRMLLERTQQQAEEMRAQEEEMRQNMEELSATQEEMARKEREYIKRIEDLEEQVHSRATAG
jgi:hypothetical protein